MNKLTLFVAMALILNGCAPQPAPQNLANVTQAQLVAVGKDSEVFKFMDGDRTCYIVENTIYINTPSGIWCTP